MSLRPNRFPAGYSCECRLVLELDRDVLGIRLVGVERFLVADTLAQRRGGPALRHRELRGIGLVFLDHDLTGHRHADVVVSHGKGVRRCAAQDQGGGYGQDEGGPPAQGVVWRCDGRWREACISPYRLFAQSVEEQIGARRSASVGWRMVCPPARRH